jgi:hypothetical protein
LRLYCPVMLSFLHPSYQLRQVQDWEIFLSSELTNLLFATLIEHYSALNRSALITAIHIKVINEWDVKISFYLKFLWKCFQSLTKNFKYFLAFSPLNHPNLTIGQRRWKILNKFLKPFLKIFDSKIKFVSITGNCYK